MNLHDILHNIACLDYQNSDFKIFGIIFSNVDMLTNTAKLAKCCRMSIKKIMGEKWGPQNWALMIF